MSNDIIIGQGSDGDIEWIEDFKDIYTLDEYISEFQSLGIDLKYSLIQGKLKSNFSKLLPPRDNEIDSISIISSLASVEQEFEDTDSPVSYLRQKVYIDKKNKEELKLFLVDIVNVLKKIKVEENIDNRLKNYEENLKKIKNKELKQNLVKEKNKNLNIEKIEEKKVNELFLNISNLMDSNSEDLKVIGNYLISTKLKVIIYLKKHIGYRKPIAFEEKLASKLKKNFKLLTVSEKIPKERTRIPYFAGNKRKLEIGWHQEVSEIVTSDQQLLDLANKLRSKLNKSKF